MSLSGLGEEARLTIVDHSVNTVCKLLRFLYTGRVSIVGADSSLDLRTGDAWELYRLAEQ